MDKIRGFINKTHYNALGNPLNRTYFNSKITQFDYVTDNARLKQIKTDTIQQLNYSYDNVGNIISINDSVNNRTYSMTYDKLDRLTNVSIGGFSWLYNYDAIGRILKVVRNSSQTTSLKYGFGPLHAPYKAITADTGVDVYKPIIYNASKRTQIVQFYLVNEKNASLGNVNYSVEFGDNYIFNSTNLSLDLKGLSLVSVERNYSTGGNYKVNVTARANTTATDFESVNLLFGTKANSLYIVKKNATILVAEIDALNTIADNSQNWGWNCSHSIISTVPFNLSSSQNLIIIIEHNFTLSQGVNLTCRVNSTDGNQSLTLPFAFDGIKIDNYNSTAIDRDTILVNFQIKNYFGDLNNINWNITADNLLYNGSGISLNQGQSATISQELNFTRGGLKQITLNIGSGNFTDAYTEYYTVKWLNLNQFFSTLKNATTRIFDFFITNKNAVNTSTQFNISNPSLNYSLNLSNNESLIVVIEENYGQGDKQVNVQVFNNSIQEDSLLEIFRIRQISIESLQTLSENSTRAVTYSAVKNNINPLNISWQLNNTEQLINSTLNVLLNTSEQMFIVIESNFSASGIYPLNFLVNSTTYNDIRTGVAVS